ncbi:MAG: hypothetical protein NkDv07_0053 [Candidatus Improbicoccus devescovinae]|nr:MAG: hypothetical protein NkDv07_0053 [Candidatus Improbicoccus devescovinae]
MSILSLVRASFYKMFRNKVFYIYLAIIMFSFRLGVSKAEWDGSKMADLAFVVGKYVVYPLVVFFTFLSLILFLFYFICIDFMNKQVTLYIINGISKFNYYVARLIFSVILILSLNVIISFLYFRITFGTDVYDANYFRTLLGWFFIEIVFCSFAMMCRAIFKNPGVTFGLIMWSAFYRTHEDNSSLINLDLEALTTGYWAKGIYVLSHWEHPKIVAQVFIIGIIYFIMFNTAGILYFMKKDIK